MKKREKSEKKLVFLFILITLMCVGCDLSECRESHSDYCMHKQAE